MKISPNHSALRAARNKLAGGDYVPDELLVRLEAGAQEFASDYGAQVVERFDFSGTELAAPKGELIRVKLPRGVDLAEAMAAMQEDSRVTYAEGNQIISLEDIAVPQPGDIPDDLTEELWGLHNQGQHGGKPGADISAVKAWETSIGDDGPLIAVIDTGVDYNHPDLRANIWTNPGEIAGNGIDDDGNGVVDDVHGYSALDDNGDPFDGNRHGTHVAGTIGAVGNNGEGVTGVMQKARLMPIKIFSAEGRTSSDIIVRGLLYAARMGADITNNSWGSRPSEAIKEAFESQDALHIMAAGNRNQDNDANRAFPSNIDVDNVVVVAASDRNDEKANYSNYGRKNVDLTAPGSDIWSTFPGGGYTSMSGTSMSAPHVTGTAGLIASAYPELSAEQIKERLIFGSDPVGALQHVSLSGGRLNAAAAIENDRLPPGEPVGFRATNLTSRGATLQWFSPGDDGTSGGGVPVEIRVSESPITKDNFDEATPYGYGGSRAAGASTSMNFLTAPDTQAQQVHFGVRAVDNVGNRSELVTSEARLPAAQLHMGEDFEGSSSQFSAGGNFHLVEDPVRGKVMLAAPREGRKRAPESSLTSAPISLEGQLHSYLRFESKTAMYWESKAGVEISEDGKRWKRVFDFEHESDWSMQGVDLSDYDGKTIQVRFKVNSRWGDPAADLALNRVEILSEQ